MQKLSNGDSLRARSESEAPTASGAPHPLPTPFFSPDERGALIGLACVIAGLHVVAALLLLIANLVA